MGVEVIPDPWGGGWWWERGSLTPILKKWFPQGTQKRLGGPKAPLRNRQGTPRDLLVKLLQAPSGHLALGNPVGSQWGPLRPLWGPMGPFCVPWGPLVAPGIFSGGGPPFFATVPGGALGSPGALGISWEVFGVPCKGALGVSWGSFEGCRTLSGPPLPPLPRLRRLHLWLLGCICLPKFFAGRSRST